MYTLSMRSLNPAREGIPAINSSLQSRNKDSRNKFDGPGRSASYLDRKKGIVFFRNMLDGQDGTGYTVYIGGSDNASYSLGVSF